MKKLIVSLTFTITLPLCQVAVAQETEITETFSDADITELKQNICNNSEVDGILLTNQPYETALNDALVPSGSYYQAKESLDVIDDDDDDDDWELEDDDVTIKLFAATTVDVTIMADPSDTSVQDAVTNICI